MNLTASCQKRYGGTRFFCNASLTDTGEDYYLGDATTGASAAQNLGHAGQLSVLHLLLGIDISVVLGL